MAGYTLEVESPRRSNAVAYTTADYPLKPHLPLPGYDCFILPFVTEQI
jgi:hypothetical protein